MAKKQIKELIVKTSSPGARQAAEEIRSLEKALDTVTKSAVATNRELGGSVKVSQNVARAYENIAKSMNSVVQSSKVMSKALNGETKTATKNLNAYIDNLQIATLYMRDLGEEAERASKSMSGVSGLDTNTRLKTMTQILTEIHDEMVKLNTQTTDVIHTLDRLADRVVDVEGQTKKTRLQTEKLNTAFDRTGTSAERAGVSTDRLNNSTRRLTGSGSQGARAFSELAFRMNPLVSLYASIAVNVYALTEAFRLLSEAANLNRLQEQTAKFAASLSGVNIKGLASELQELSGYAISAADALRQTVRGVSYGFLVEDMERLTAGARKASIALGIDFADAMDRAFRGISKGEVEVLDEIGVVTRLDTAYAKYAVTLGKSADALTDVERRMALTNEVISQLESRFSAFDVAASGMESLGVATKDAVNSLLIMASTGFDKPAKSIARVLRGFTGVQSAAKDAAEAQKVYNEAIKEGRTSQAAVALAEYEKAMDKVAKQNIKGTKENREFNESVSAAATAADIATKSVTALGIYMAYYATKVLVTATVNTIKYVTASWAAAAAGNANIVWTVIYSGVLKAKAAALAVATAATGGYTVALWAAAAAAGALLSPIVVVVGAITAVGLAFAGLAKLLFGFSAFDWIADKISWLGDKIGDFFSWLGLKAKDAGKAVIRGVGSGLDSVAGQFGIDDKIADAFGLDDATMRGVTDNQIDLYISNLRASAAKIPKNLVEMPVGNISTPLDGMKAATTPLALAVDTYVEARNDFVTKSMDITRSEAETNIKYFQNTKDAVIAIGKEFKTLSEYDTPIKRLAASMQSFADIPVSVDVNEKGFKEVETRFENLKAEKIIPMDVEWNDGRGFQDFNNRLQSAVKIIEDYDRNGAFQLEAFNAALDSTSPVANIQSVQYELMQINRVLESQIGLGEGLNAKQREELEKKSMILQLTKQQLETDRSIQVFRQKQELSLAAELGAMQQKVHLQSDLVAKEIEYLEVEKQKLKDSGRSTEEIQHQINLMNIRLGIAKQEEAIALKKASIEFAISQQEQRISQQGNQVSKVKEQERLLQLEESRIALMTDELEKTRALMELGAQKDQLSRDKQAAPFADAGSVLSSISGIDGLTDMQSNFASTLGTMSSTYSDFLSNMDSQSMSFVEYLSGNITALADVGQAALSMAQSVYADISASKIEAINQEIAAEQRRDGKSAESLAKIKRLNAQRIKEETKAKKASVMMSTATAIMQAMAQIPFPANIAVAAATGIMGMKQLANIDKAANGQLSALNTGPGGDMSISAGNRDNAIDVSKSANAGELGYLRGASGTGTANNFIPGRAGGNNAMAGAAITVGESGPETIVPRVPVSVQPAGQSSGGNVTYAPVYNMQAIDASGMEELLVKHSKSVYKGLETELNANNMTLSSLK